MESDVIASFAGGLGGTGLFLLAIRTLWLKLNEERDKRDLLYERVMSMLEKIAGSGESHE